MRLYPYLFILMFCFSGLTLNAQKADNDTANYPYWAEMMHRSAVNFNQTVRAFETYWEGRKIEKGSGWKPFKRWEYYWQYRLDENGNLPAGDDVFNSYFGLNKEKNNNPLEQKSEEDIVTYTGKEGNWSAIGPITVPKNNTGQPTGLGRINAVGFHPTDSNIFYVGAPAGGLWQTKDYGKTWETHTDSLPTLGVSSIVVDYVNPNIVYIGTGDRDASNAYGYGVLKSFDGGISWQVSNTGMGSRTVGKLLIHPKFRDSLIAATSGGVYVSANGGANWSRKSNGRNYKDLVRHPTNTSIVYACERDNFFRSTDGGNSWVQITNGIPSGQRGVIGVSADKPNYVYFLLSQSSVYKGTYLSTDAGASFVTQSTTPNILGYPADGSGTTGQGWYDLCITVDPNDADVLYIGGVNIFKSTDGGKTWAISGHWTGSGGGDAIHADQHILKYSPVTEVLFVGNDGGVYYTNDNGKDWVDISSGLAIAQIYKLGHSAHDRKILINGYQDNGTSYYNGKWQTIRGGDGMDCLVDYSDPSIMVGSIYYGNFVRYKDGKSQGVFARVGSRGITESGGWVTPIIQSHSNPDVFFAGYKNVWRTTNGKTEKISDVSWDKISDDLGSSNTKNITALEQAIKNKDLLYMSRSDKKFFRSENINATTPTWVDLTSKLPANNTPRCIETSHSNPSRVYIGIGKKVYRSDNKGDTWVDITGNIPNLNIQSIVVDYTKTTEDIYVGTDVGVYYKNLTMTNWVYFNAGLPLSVDANEVEIFYNPRNNSNSKLRAATYGRGTWESDLYTDGTKKPVVDFFSDRLETCVGSVINFEDNTGYIPTSWKWKISPSTTTYVSNTTDSSQNTSIQFNSSGNYTITLTATNANGSDSLVQAAMIYVYDTVKRMCITTKTGGTGFGIGIMKVKLANVENTSQGTDQNGSYEDYSCGQIIQLKKDSSYTLEVTTGLYNDEYVKAFVDFNNDGDFKDFGETIFNGIKKRTNHTGTFTVPNYATQNKLLRMRVISDFRAIGSPDCPTLLNGQSEDYNVYLSAPSITQSITQDSVCIGATTIITAISSGKAQTIDWDFGADATPQTASGEGSFSISYSTSGYKSIKATINGSIVKQKDSVIWVGSTPVAKFAYDDTLLCKKDRSVNFINQSSIAAGNINYLWRLGDGSSSTLQHLQYQYANSSNTTYTVKLIATSDIGCIDSISSTVTPKTTIVKSDFTINTTDQCLESNQFSYSNTSQVPTGNTITSTWSFGDGTNLVSPSGVNHVYTSDGTKVVWLKIESDKGCVDSVFKMVQVIAHPVATFSAPKSSCDGEQVNFNNQTLVRSGTTVSYKWYFGDGDSSTLNSPTRTYTSPAQYLVRLFATDNNGCEDDTTQQVLVRAKPIVGFTKQYQGNGEVKFTPNQSGFALYDWNFGDGNTSSIVSPVHKYIKEGTYTVTLLVEDDESCRNSNSDTVNVVSGLGINSLQTTIQQLKAIPNPFDDNIRVSFSVIGKQKVTVYITDILGRKILDVLKTQTITDKVSVDADTKALAAGVYFVVVESGNRKQTLKMVK